MSTADLARYLECGLALVPIPLGQKRPVNPRWNVRSSVITDRAAANRLIGMNLGIAHAFCQPAPTVAIDIDEYRAALRWFANRDIELNRLLRAPDAVVIHSGKKFSLKLLYRLPDDYPGLESIKIASPDRPTILEFRCATKNGLTVQDLLPPSIHPSGERYRFIGRGSVLSLPTIPENLLRVWKQILTERDYQRSKRVRTLSNRYCTPQTPRHIAQVQKALSKISAHCGYERWRNVIWALLSTGWDCAEGLAEAWSRTAPELFDDNAFWLVVNSYDRSHDDAITLGTLYHYAKQEACHV